MRWDTHIPGLAEAKHTGRVRERTHLRAWVGVGSGRVQTGGEGGRSPSRNTIIRIIYVEPLRIGERGLINGNEPVLVVLVVLMVRRSVDVTQDAVVAMMYRRSLGALRLSHGMGGQASGSGIIRVIGVLSVVVTQVLGRQRLRSHTIAHLAQGVTPLPRAATPVGFRPRLDAVSGIRR